MDTSNGGVVVVLIVVSCDGSVDSSSESSYGSDSLVSGQVLLFRCHSVYINCV